MKGGGDEGAERLKSCGMGSKGWKVGDVKGMEGREEAKGFEGAGRVKEVRRGRGKGFEG